MSTHEPNVREETIESGSDRSFGLIVGGVLAAIGAWQWFKGAGLYPWFLASGIALVVFGVLLPKFLHPLNLAWTSLGLLLGRIVTPVVMFLVYTVSVVPIGVVMRLLGKDPLGLAKADPDASYWKDRDPPGPPPESLKDQF